MTRHNLFWRLRANTERAVKESGEPPVRLRGGPADGWVVKDHAPMLNGDWHATRPDSARQEFRPSRYVLADMDRDARVAVWEDAV